MTAPSGFSFSLRSIQKFWRLPLFLTFLFIMACFPENQLSAQESYTFQGRGTAHGVGLDMSGVKALADDGVGFERILKIYYSGVTIAGGQEGQTMRIGILNGSELQFTSDRSYKVYPNNTGGGVSVPRDVITHVTYESGRYVTRIDGAGVWRSTGFTRLNTTSGGHIKTLNNNRKYRGHMEARRSTTGKLWAINVINIEDYIKGLAEEPNSWPREGQRTLAVAARTYGLNKKLYSTRWDPENFDVDATMGSQYYIGFDAERSNLVQAVNDTRGKVINYGGKAIVAAYHGNSGGHTESLHNVWGGSASSYPYLKGVPSPWGKVYHWGPKTFTRKQLEDIFNGRPESRIGTLYSIDLSDRTASGRVRKAKLIGSAGTKEVWGFSQFAAWLGFRSSLIDAGADNWDQFVLLQNTNRVAAKVRLTFLSENGRKKVVKRRVPPNSRKTVSVDKLIWPGANALKISADNSVVAERSVYFKHGNSGGGHSTVGARRPSRRWYFAGGQTGRNIDTWLIIANPRTAPVTVTAIFMPGKGKRVIKRVRVGGNSRKSIRVKNITGLRSKATPVVVKSPKPIMVERSSYFKFKKRVGGFTSIGSNRLSKNWYFAEGFTGKGFEVRLFLFNPKKNSTKARVTIAKKNGQQVSRTYKIGSRRRREIILNQMVSGTDFGIKVHAPTKIVAARTVYFNSSGRSGAHSTVGSPRVYKKWYFAEGHIDDRFDELIAIYNPTGYRAAITLTYRSENGAAAITRTYSVNSKSRKTVTMGGANGFGAGKSFSVELQSTRRVVAERVMYFDYGGNNGLETWTGGHVTMGAVKPSKLWYFAEGFNK